MSAYPCAYCGGPGGFVPGPAHGEYCHRYRVRGRRVKTIRGRSADRAIARAVRERLAKESPK